MHVIGIQMTFKLLIWPLMTFYNLYLLFQHQNRVRRPQKWLETCVTHIYWDVIYLPYARFSKMAAILDFSLHSLQHRGENRGKLIFIKVIYQSLMCEKISFLHFFSKWKCIALGLSSVVLALLRVVIKKRKRFNFFNGVNH